MADRETRLRRIREEMGLTQETVARRTTLTFGTYRRAEDGYPVKYSTAQEILQAINSFLREKGKAEVSLNDLDLTLM
ncbi:MAG: helix-turn-helix domain-containing protein [Ktedonobacteraceae bacterium]